MAASVLDLVPIIHNILCEVESRSEEDRKVAVLHYLNNLSSTYSGFENTCIFPQRLLTLVDSENFGGNIVDVSSIIRTDDTDKYQMMDCRILGTASIKGLLLNVAWYIQFKLRITCYSIPL